MACCSAAASAPGASTTAQVREPTCPALHAASAIARVSGSASWRALRERANARASIVASEPLRDARHGPAPGEHVAQSVNLSRPYLGTPSAAVRRACLEMARVDLAMSAGRGARPRARRRAPANSAPVTNGGGAIDECLDLGADRLLARGVPRDAHRLSDAHPDRRAAARQQTQRV